MSTLKHPGIKDQLATEIQHPEICDSLNHANHIANILKALSHPIRIRIIAMLCNGSEHVSAMATRLEIKQAIISQQLRILRMHHLVEVTRSNGFAYYSLAEPRLRNLINCVQNCSIA